MIKKQILLASVLAVAGTSAMAGGFGVAAVEPEVFDLVAAEQAGSFGGIGPVAGAAIAGAAVLAIALAAGSDSDTDTDD